MIVRKQQADDYEAILHVYAEAYRRPHFRPPLDPGSVPPEVPLFEALREAGDALPELSFTALTDGGWSATSRQARRPSPPTRLWPSDRSGFFRSIKAWASGAL